MIGILEVKSCLIGAFFEESIGWKFVSILYKFCYDLVCMREIYSFLDYKKYVGLQEYELTLMRENIELVIYSVFGFLVPFLLAQPQLLVGSVVNAALVLGALNLRGAKILPIILLPSIGVLFAGVMFGGFTQALLYMVPFIWAANVVLVLAIKEFALRRKVDKVKSLLVGAVLKSGFLFASAFLLFYSGLVPVAILGAMGILQLQTAMIGGGAALLIQEGKKRLF